MDDFDFLHGSWTVVNRRLRRALAGETEWDVYPGTATCRPILDGVGNTDEIVFPTRGTRGFTLRLYDLERQEWSIYWANSRRGVLEPPVVGTFAGDRGDFHGDDVHEGRPIKVHFTWSATTSGAPVWQQEFSADGGRTWEPNWTMEFHRP